MYVGLTTVIRIYSRIPPPGVLPIIGVHRRRSGVRILTCMFETASWKLGEPENLCACS
jgi:hypothetical protein